MHPSLMPNNAPLDVFLEKGTIEMAHKYDKEMYERGLWLEPGPELVEKVTSEKPRRQLMLPFIEEYGAI